VASADKLMVEEDRILPSVETGMSSLKLPPIGALGAPSELLLRLLLLLLLLLEPSVTTFTKKSWRPTSQLKVAVAACMTLARHADEMQSIHRWQSPH